MCCPPPLAAGDSEATRRPPSFLQGVAVEVDAGREPVPRRDRPCSIAGVGHLSVARRDASSGRLWARGPGGR
eukprot:11187049-Lingulodinium_polyedra.AAC.1